MAYTVSKLTDYSAAALERASGELLSALGDEAAAIKSEVAWKAVRDRWMARKNGILTQINDLWLKGAPKEAKREVGQQVNRIKEQVAQKIE
ncbi:MAG: phenylalanine--tRNA ligase subunit alpha, partial [Candidatus Sulfotelmatobacter sp.]